MAALERFIGNRLYLDTNVFIYFVERHSGFGGVLDELFAAISASEIEAVTSELTFAEVMIKPVKMKQPHVVASYTKLLSTTTGLEMRPVDRATLLKGSELCAYWGGDLTDALHVATAQLADCDHILSEDRSLIVPPPLQHLRLSELNSGIAIIEPMR